MMRLWVAITVDSDSLPLSLFGGGWRGARGQLIIDNDGAVCLEKVSKQWLPHKEGGRERTTQLHARLDAIVLVHQETRFMCSL